MAIIRSEKFLLEEKIREKLGDNYCVKQFGEHWLRTVILRKSFLLESEIAYKLETRNYFEATDAITEKELQCLGEIIDIAFDKR